MIVTLSGGTGLMGSALYRQFAERGYAIRILTRSVEIAKEKLQGEFTAYPWSPTEELPPGEALAGADVVIHLAGEKVGDGLWNQKKKKRIYDSRILSTRNLVSALGKLDSAQRPKTLVGASASGYYGSRGEEPLTEQSGPGTGFWAELVQDWERELVEAEAFNVRLAFLRSGLVLSPRGGALEKLVPIFKAGLGGPIGKGDQWVSWIHLDDLVRAILFTMENANLVGPINCVSPHPVRNREFTKTIGQILKRPTRLTVPAIPLRVFLREMALLLLDSQRIAPEKLERAGFNFLYSEVREALEDLLAKKASPAAP